jgi:hypothetical protein
LDRLLRTAYFENRLTDAVNAGSHYRATLPTDVGLPIFPAGKRFSEFCYPHMEEKYKHTRFFHYQVWDTPAEEITDFYIQAMSQRGWRLIYRKKRERRARGIIENWSAKFTRETPEGSTQSVKFSVMWHEKRPDDVWKSHRDHEVAQVSLSLDAPPPQP